MGKGRAQEPGPRRRAQERPRDERSRELPQTATDVDRDGPRQRLQVLKRQMIGAPEAAPPALREPRGKLMTGILSDQGRGRLSRSAAVAP